MSKRKSIRVTLPAKHVADFEQAKKLAEGAHLLGLSDAQYATFLVKQGVARALAPVEFDAEEAARVLERAVAGGDTRAISEALIRQRDALTGGDAK